MSKTRRQPTPTEDAAITAAAKRDPDNPPLTDGDLARLRPAREIVPDIVSAHRERRLRGPQKAPTKHQVTLRLDQDVIDHFKAGGQGWQTRINETLKTAIKGE